MERKLLEKHFIVVLIAILATSGLLWGGHLQAGNYEQIIIWVVGLFVAGGAAEKWAEFYNPTKKTV